MLPPVLEIYVVWHPEDSAGAEAAEQIFDHFHGTVFSGLIGGAIEVYARSLGFQSDEDAPRPIPFPRLTVETGPADVVAQAQRVAVVPILGTELAAAIETGATVWRDYIKEIADAAQADPERVGVFPLAVDRGAADGTVLGRLLGRFQRIAEPAPAAAASEAEASLRCRDLAQGIAQLGSGPDTRLTVFLSHTKRVGVGETGEEVAALIELVKNTVTQTRLQYFFDVEDLQPGRDWAQALEDEAGKNAVLALRTDLYASRAWCQREMLIAKRRGVPIIVLDALRAGEERGSFLMDHLPRINIAREGDVWNAEDIMRGLNLLVDECLKHKLWELQQELAAEHPDLAVAWWAPHAPEPVNLVQWLEDRLAADTLPTGDKPLRILHPDPPLGVDEREALHQIALLSGYCGTFDIMTPRLFAARGA